MTEFTPARLAEMRAVAEAATEPDYYVCDCYVQCGDEVCPNPKPIYKTHDNDTVLALIAALEAKTAALERVRAVRSFAPECDKYDDDSPIVCGWKRTVQSIDAALEAGDDGE